MCLGSVELRGFAPFSTPVNCLNPKPDTPKPKVFGVGTLVLRQTAMLLGFRAKV